METQVLTPEEKKLQEDLLNRALAREDRKASAEQANLWAGRIALVAATLGLVHLLGKIDTLRGFAVLDAVGEKAVNAVKTGATAVYHRVLGTTASA